MNTRRFSGSAEFEQPQRTVEEAPPGLRAEFAGVVFDIADRLESMEDEPTNYQLYLTIAQRLGIPDPAHDPANGFRLRGQQYLVQCDWRRFYDVVESLFQRFPNSARASYRGAVEGILAGHGIAWHLTETRHLERVLPAPLAAGIRETHADLRTAGYQAARQLFEAALDAFNDRPRRDRDAVGNAFDAMEAAAKIRLALPQATFGQVVQHVDQNNVLNADIRQVLRHLKETRNHQFGHGTHFTLTPAEIDFVFVACAAGARLFVRF